jgi:fructosamine-3-kinase
MQPVSDPLNSQPGADHPVLVESQERLTELGLGRPERWTPLSGGAVSEVYRLRTTFGASVVVKTHADPPPDLYRKEAAGLDELRAAGGFVVPEVVAVTDRLLILDDLGTAADRSDDHWADGGRRLASQHARTAPQFGYHHDNYLGSLTQYNTWTDDGHAFFAEHRLLRFLTVPLCAEALGPADRRRLERLASQLTNLVPLQPACLLHGDLWHANLLADSAGRPAVIDPAVYYGWPEAELSMVRECGQVPEAFFDGYQEIRPLADGWRQRMPLLHLREILSVVAHFGDRYGSVQRVREILDRFAGRRS